MPWFMNNAIGMDAPVLTNLDNITALFHTTEFSRLLRPYSSHQRDFELTACLFA